MHRGRIDILCEVIVAMAGSLRAHTATALLVELIQVGTLDVTHVRNGDNHRIVGIEVLGIELVVEGDNLCTTCVAILLFHLLQLVLHDLLAALGVVQDFLQVGNELHQVVVLLVQLVDTQTCELAETHIDDSLRLQLVQVEALLQVTLGVRRSLTITDDMYHLVDIVHSDNQSFEDVGTLLGFLQVVLGTTDSHVVTMLNEVLDTLLEVQQTGTTLDQCDIVDRERALQGSHLEQLVEQHISIGIALAVNDDTHTLTTRLIVHVGHALNLVFVGEVSDIFHEVGLVDTIRNLRNYNLVVGLGRLNLGLGAHNDTATTSLIGVAHALQTIEPGIYCISPSVSISGLSI